MDGIARIVNACLMALRPVLHASWCEKCSEIGILADECWITSSGAEIIDILRAVDFDAKSQPRSLCPHRFETYDFEAMYPNLPDAALQEVMRKLLKYTFKYQSQHGLFSIEIRWGFEKIPCPFQRNLNSVTSPLACPCLGWAEVRLRP